MLCSGCGKDIPFAGQVCPHCQRDKTQDQANHTLIVICLLGCTGLGYWINGFTGALWGFGVGVVISFILAVAAAGSTQSKPPEVRLAQDPEKVDPPAAQPSASPDIRSRLAAVDALRQEGLISDAEHAAKRQKILDEI